jgi:hypothetical protein
LVIIFSWCEPMRLESREGKAAILIVGVDGPTASRARIGAVGNQNRSRP